MIYLFLWWFLLILVSFAALPVTMRFLRFLPDRGYAFAKPLALLLWVYPFWLLAVFGFIHNTMGALAVLLVLVVVLSWGLLRGKGKDSVLAWLRENWKYALVVEIVFGVAFLAFAYFRAFNPEISATEKPMEFMFLNSILQSDTFPPRDAWLAGYAISYYYLGYVIVAALAKLGNIPSGYAFNLGLIMTFAMAAVGAFGLVFNAVTYAQQNDSPRAAKRSPFAFGVLAVFLLLVIGNLQAVFEVAYNAEIGPRDFYASLNLHGLEEIQPSGTGIPEDNWWWWRASRVLNDINPTDGGHLEVIDEFPAFSFLLGDLHPHVLALPFGVLALAVALNLLLTPHVPITGLQSLQSVLLTPRVLLVALIVGALGMLNTWDIVTYGFVIAAAFAIAQNRVAQNLSRWMLATALGFLLAIYVGGYILFLPFYLGFASQAQGILPQLTKTPLHQYLIMFGLFVFVMASLVVFLFLRQNDKRRVLVSALEFAVPLIAVPIVIALGGMLALVLLPNVGEQIISLLQLDAQNPIASAASVYFGALRAQPWVFVLLVVLIAGIAALGRLELEETGNSNARTMIVFALLLALIGFTLTFGTEFLFIRDTFGYRMNTVFKLYYQAWVLLAMASAFAAYYIWSNSRALGRGVWGAAFLVLLALSLIYPALAFPSKANFFNAQETPPTLDGWAWVARAYPDDYAAIEWVRANVPRSAVILEAAGSQYSFDNRVSVATGIPTVLGWGGHELQWRGNYDQAGPRENDIQQIYRSRNLDETRQLLAKYHVDYVIVGGSERNKYQLNAALADKFGKIGEMVFEQGQTRIYRVGQANVSLRVP